jgi:hypothetical protein
MVGVDKTYGIQSRVNEIAELHLTGLNAADLGLPARTPISCCQNRPPTAHCPSVRSINEVYGVQNNLCAADLRLPARTPVSCCQNCSVKPDDPPVVVVNKIYGTEPLRSARGLRTPTPAAIGGCQNGPLSSRYPPSAFINKVYRLKQHDRRADKLRPPIRAPIGGRQNRSVTPDHPSLPRIKNLHSEGLKRADGSPLPAPTTVARCQEEPATRHRCPPVGGVDTVYGVEGSGRAADLRPPTLAAIGRHENPPELPSRPPVAKVTKTYGEESWASPCGRHYCLPLICGWRLGCGRLYLSLLGSYAIRRRRNFHLSGRHHEGGRRWRGLSR